MHMRYFSLGAGKGGSRKYLQPSYEYYDKTEFPLYAQCLSLQLLQPMGACLQAAPSPESETLRLRYAPPWGQCDAP